MLPEISTGVIQRRASHKFCLVMLKQVIYWPIPVKVAEINSVDDIL
jgi:hypothetical protein